MIRNDTSLSRRTFLDAASGALVSIGFPGTFMTLADAAQRSLAAETRSDGKPRLPPGQTAVAHIQDMGGEPGAASVADWRLRIHGEVGNSDTLSFADLMQFKQVRVTCDIHYVTGWTLLDSVWSGVCLADIMEKAQPTAAGIFLIFESAHGYTANIPMTDLGGENVILAHSLFDRPLSSTHGGPVRALVPDRYLYKSAKWLEGVKIVARDEPGFWETRGYSNSADP